MSTFPKGLGPGSAGQPVASWSYSVTARHGLLTHGRKPLQEGGRRESVPTSGFPCLKLSLRSFSFTLQLAQHSDREHKESKVSVLMSLGAEGDVEE